MGYCGLESSGASDTASGFLWTVSDAVAKQIIKELKDKGNEFNTSGAVNCAFFVSEILLPSLMSCYENDHGSSFVINENLINAIKSVKKELQKEIKSSDSKHKDYWDDEANRIEHHNRFKELMADIDEYLDHAKNFY